MRKTLSVILIAVMLLSILTVVPFSSSAATKSGDYQ